MAYRSTECPKCQGRMGPGFIVDEGYGTKKVGHWHAGKPVKSVWFGLKLTGKSIPISTFRCDRCGYLESYAVSE